MIDTLIVARNNRYGLTRDAELLADALRRAGVETAVADIRDRTLGEWLLRRRRARRIIHLERVFPRWFGAADEHYAIPNQERFPRRHLRRLRRLDGILAKTLEGAAAFAGLGTAVEHLGFTSQDRHDPSVTRQWNGVLHLAGGSTLKGTEDVLALWDRHPEWSELTLVQKQQNAPKHVPANVRLIAGYIDDAELRRLQNACAIHLCPSRAEGWGHNIVEAMSCGALVIATDAAPMNEHVRPEFGLLVRSARTEERHLGTCHYVDRSALEAAIKAALAMPWPQKARMGEEARRRFLEIDVSFHARVARLLGHGSPASAAAEPVR